MPRPLSIAIGLLMILGVLAGFGWWLWHCLKNSDDPPKLLFKWILTFLCMAALVWLVVGVEGLGRLTMPFVAVAIGVVMSIVWAPHIGAVSREVRQGWRLWRKGIHSDGWSRARQ